MTAQDRFRLDGRRVVVTGAAGIIGRHVVAQMLAAGARVALLDRNAEALDQALADIAGEDRDRTLGFECDVADQDSVAAAFAEVDRVFGGLDVLHNNAAAKCADLRRFFTAFEDYDLATWREIMAVNLDGMFLVAQAAGRRLIAQGTGGSVIQTASIYGAMAPDARIYEGSDYLGGPINTPAVYSASKGGVIALTRHLAAIWAPHRIRVNTVSPGGVESGQNDIFRQRYSARVPLARMAQADEIAAAVVYLAADASSYVTGQNLLVDGGLSAW